jgi:photoactive yellow protein
MLDLTESPASTPFDPRTVDDRSDAELDAQPFGVIGLDDEGTILRYNLYESRFARLDRNQVIGRNFFSEVARCTQNDAFEGRFRKVVAAANDSYTERFNYLFDFKFGAQEVSVDIVKAPGVDRYYLLINRSKVSAPRPDFPVELLAVQQSQLAPDERDHGVIRDELERRFVDVPAPFFAALRATCDRLAPDTWQLFSLEWGVQWGRRAAVDLEAASLESPGVSLRDLPMREVANRVTDYLSKRGWGSLAFDFSTTPEGLIVLTLDRSVLAESAPARRTVSPGAQRACALIAGFATGAMSTIAQRRLTAREFSCVASGASQCRLTLVGHERRSVLDDAIRDGVTSVDGIRASLRRSGPSRETVR